MPFAGDLTVKTEGNEVVKASTGPDERVCYTQIATNSPNQMLSPRFHSLLSHEKAKGDRSSAKQELRPWGQAGRDPPEASFSPFSKTLKNEDQYFVFQSSDNKPVRQSALGLEAERAPVLSQAGHEQVILSKQTFGNIACEFIDNCIEEEDHEIKECQNTAGDSEFIDEPEILSSPKEIAALQEGELRLQAPIHARQEQPVPTYAYKLDNAFGKYELKPQSLEDARIAHYNARHLQCYQGCELSQQELLRHQQQQVTNQLI